MSQNESSGNTDPQRGARDADAMHSGDKSHLKMFSGLSDALSNDENGFSNKEGFNTDRGHEKLAGSGGSGTSDMNSLDNAHDIDDDFSNDDNTDENFPANSDFDGESQNENNRQSDSGSGFSRQND